MEHGRTNLTEAVRSVRLLKLDGYCVTAAMDSSYYIKSRWNVDGHEWEVRLLPGHFHYESSDGRLPWVALQLMLLSEPQRNNLNVNANLSCRLVDPSRHLDPSPETGRSRVFQSRGELSSAVLLVRRRDVPSSGYLVNDSLTVQCAITVLKELPDVVVPAPAASNTEAPLPPIDLQRHLGELLQCQRGGDVTFVLHSGERFVAHKAILAARSPVFMAQFFGHMNERSSQCVSVQDMEASAFKVMLHFIYTDTAPELDDEDPEAAATMAQHLLVAADRYGLDRLKLICERKLSGGIDIDTAATTLALAEQHSCALLKAKCVEFIARSPETLDAVLATDGYRHLVQSCPMVLSELLRAARGRNV
ncbi:hypothetical protein U9M48_026641 [Paspalum notatum var. saurae]|uniref:BTB domain-containing protein n=1 Tax=Paspalum notatum var. saurae TaxID=547442 RepID=A0AAQ3TVP0_PASNO